MPKLKLNFIQCVNWLNAHVFKHILYDLWSTVKKNEVVPLFVILAV